MRIVGPILIAFVLIGNSFVIFGQTLFSDVSKEANVRFTHVLPSSYQTGYETGAAWLDMDNDGDLDLYVSQYLGPNSLYRNNMVEIGRASFTKVGIKSALDSGHIGTGVSIADYDNDGDPDIYLANFDQDVLLQNDGLGNFTDITEIAFPEFPSFLPGKGQTASWGDLDNDGWLDLYISNHKKETFSPQDYLFKNNGGYPVTFSNVSYLLASDTYNNGILDTNGFGFVAVFTDFDNDDDLDIYATNDCPFGPEDNKLWQNDGDWSFREVSNDYGPFSKGKLVDGERVPDCNNVMGIAVGDPNRDGIFDYFHTNWNGSGATAVYLQNDGNQFLDRTVETGLDDERVPGGSAPRITWGTVFVDYDLDMLLDLAIAGGQFFGDADSSNFYSQQPNMLYRNEGIKNNLPSYSRIEDDTSGFADIRKGRTLISGDYDLDGDVDLFLVNYGKESVLFRNENKNQNNWLNITLDGAGSPFSNRNGIGAKIKITTPDLISQHWEIRSGSSLGGGDDVAAYFGLAENTIASIEIKWPSGLVQHLNEVQANQRLIIKEPAMKILFPALNESFFFGDLVNIRWENEFKGSVYIQLLLYDNVILTLADGLDVNEFSWQIPNDLEISDKYSIRIVSELNETYYADSYGYFNINENLINEVDQIVTAYESISNWKCYPNPFVNSLKINYQLLFSSDITIKVYNVFGQLVSEVINVKKQPPGDYVFDLELNGLKGGMYFCRINTSDSVFSKKIIKN